MADLLVELDPTAEGTGTVLTYASLGDLTEHSAPPPPLSGVYASSISTEGGIPAGLKYDNGEIRDTLVVHGTTAADLETKLGSLSKKLGKIQREGGTYKRTSVTGSAVVFDLLPESDGDVAWDVLHLAGNAATVSLRYTRRPFWRGPEQSLGSFTELTLPVLQAVVTGVKGSGLALGRAVMTATAGDQSTVFTGVQSRYYDASAHASLFYEAEGRTPLGGAAIAVGSATPSGAGSNVMRQGTLTPVYQAMMSTHALAGTPLQHIGSFEVLARVYRPTSNTGAVSLYLEWGAGDYQTPTKNDPVSFAADAFEGQWLLVKLGAVHIPKATQGTQKWEGRIVAKSTVTGDDLDVDWIGLVPTSAEGDPACYAEWSGISRVQTPTAFSGRSDFTTESGVITGDTPGAGPVWVGSGSATDVSAAAGVATRTAVSDASETGRFLTQDLNMTATVVQIDAKSSSTDGNATNHNVLARWSAATTYVRAGWQQTGTGRLLIQFFARNGGATAVLQEVTGPLYVANGYYTTKLVIYANGAYALWVFLTGGTPGAPVIQGSDPVLATGGALATGDPGFYDERNAATADTRTYDNYAAWVPVADAACFSGQSLEIRHDRAERENAGGTTWNRVSSRRGRYLRFAPAGQEGRSNRLFLKGVRGAEVQDNVWSDPSIDDVAVDLFATTLGVAVPEP